MPVATDKYRFYCVWRGSWYWLGSLSDHIKHKVDLSGPTWLLIDQRTYAAHIVPRSEVHIRDSGPI
jgi:hypothetical protein